MGFTIRYPKSLHETKGRLFGIPSIGCLRGQVPALTYQHSNQNRAIDTQTAYFSYLERRLYSESGGELQAIPVSKEQAAA
jgi:hypothetical protein